MNQERQLAKALIDESLSITQWVEGVKIASKLRELNVPAKEALNFLETTCELWDPDFKASAYELLNLRKQTGKSLKEIEVYLKNLNSEVAGKEKQKTDLEKIIESLKGEIEDWQRKRREEKDKFEAELDQNKHILEEDRAKLESELRENKLIRENIEKVINHESKLKNIGLDLLLFDTIIEEIIQKAGISPDIGKKVSEDLNKLGSLNKALAERESEEKLKKETISKLSKEESKRRETLKELDLAIKAKRGIIETLNMQIEEKKQTIATQDRQIMSNKWQYEFFECFISMLLNSPSAKDPLSSLGQKLQELSREGWIHSSQTTPEQRRAIFILNVMGGYLHSIRCDKCKATFIVNKSYNAFNRYYDSYECPVCRYTFYIKPDDTFLNLIMSPELPKRLQTIRQLIEKVDLEALERKLTLLNSLPQEFIDSAIEAAEKYASKGEG